jgi:hypothetical protein
MQMKTSLEYWSQYHLAVAGGSASRIQAYSKFRTLIAHPPVTARWY